MTSIDSATGSDGHATLRERVAAQNWFHAIDFGEFRSSGRRPADEVQNITLFGAFDLLTDIDLHGMDCLDVGTFDGLLAFAEKMAGAARVTAVDSFERKTFSLAREALGLDIEYLPNVQFSTLAGAVGSRRFDLISATGILYHMLNPASLFHVSRRMLKHGGLLLLESQITGAGLPEPALLVNAGATDFYREPHSYFIPNAAAIPALMQMMSFDVLAIRQMPAANRITVLGRALCPEEVRDRTDLCKAIHERDFTDHDFSLKSLEGEPASTIAWRGKTRLAAINPKAFSRTLPPHAGLEKTGVGGSVWFSKLGNWIGRR